MISYAITKAQTTNSILKVIVFTDSPEIVKISDSFNAEVPF